MQTHSKVLKTNARLQEEHTQPVWDDPRTHTHTHTETSLRWRARNASFQWQHRWVTDDDVQTPPKHRVMPSRWRHSTQTHTHWDHAVFTDSTSWKSNIQNKSIYILSTFQTT